MSDFYQIIWAHCNRVLRRLVTREQKSDACRTVRPLLNIRSYNTRLTLLAANATVSSLALATQTYQRASVKAKAIAGPGSSRSH